MTDWERRADKLARLEYMLRCKRDIIWEIMPAIDDAKYHAAIEQLDSAITRVSTRLSEAIANGG